MPGRTLVANASSTQGRTQDRSAQHRDGRCTNPNCRERQRATQWQRTAFGALNRIQFMTYSNPAYRPQPAARGTSGLQQVEEEWSNPFTAKARMAGCQELLKKYSPERRQSNNNLMKVYEYLSKKFPDPESPLVPGIDALAKILDEEHSIRDSDSIYAGDCAVCLEAIPSDDFFVAGGGCHHIVCRPCVLNMANAQAPQEAVSEESFPNGVVLKCPCCRHDNFASKPIYDAQTKASADLKKDPCWEAEMQADSDPQKCFDEAVEKGYIKVETLPADDSRPKALLIVVNGDTTKDANGKPMGTYQLKGLFPKVGYKWGEVGGEVYNARQKGFVPRKAWFKVAEEEQLEQEQCVELDDCPSCAASSGTGSTGTASPTRPLEDGEEHSSSAKRPRCDFGAGSSSDHAASSEASVRAAVASPQGSEHSVLPEGAEVIDLTD
jgi:hypothetical protein